MGGAIGRVRIAAGGANWGSFQSGSTKAVCREFAAAQDETMHGFLTDCRKSEGSCSRVDLLSFRASTVARPIIPKTYCHAGVGHMRMNQEMIVSSAWFVPGKGEFTCGTQRGMP